MILDTALSFNDVLLVPQYSTVASRQDVDLSTNISPSISLSIPLISVNMDTVTGIEMAKAMDSLGGISFYPRFNTIENIVKDIKEITESGKRVIASIGIKDGYLERARELILAGAVGLTIDVAHAHTKRTIQVVESLKQNFPKTPLIVGTIATYQGAMELFVAGANAVRVGVGAGTICTTRIVSGHGVPQITAISEAVRARDDFMFNKFLPGLELDSRYVIADGGMVNSGDIVKALALGADAACCGSLFAGTDEAPGEIIEENGKKYKSYNGSTSKIEKESQVSKDNSDKNAFYTQHVEGVAGRVKYKGPVENVVKELLAGVRSGLSYSGAHKLSELKDKAKFVKITSAGLIESQAHDIIIA